MTRFRKGTERSMLEDAGSVGVHSDFKEEGSKKYENAKLAIFFAVYLALLQQMSGVNAIVVYGK